LTDEEKQYSFYKKFESFLKEGDLRNLSL